MIFDDLTIIIKLISLEPFSSEALVIFFLFPLVVELPFYFVVMANVLHHSMERTYQDQSARPYFPLISCIVAAYSEGTDVQKILYSLREQLYLGPIEVLVVLDNAPKNEVTRKAVLDFIAQYPNYPGRKIMLLARKTRGGHASSFNLGLKIAKGEYLLMLDADCSCDNDVLSLASEHFLNKNIVGLSGTLRARNANLNLVTRLQAIEYSLGIGLARVGLGHFKTLNNISGAFGLFKRDFLIKIGGWKNGSAEDLDLTLRIQSYFRKHPELEIKHDSRIVAQTDVPNTFLSLLKQRFRWEGDLFFIYCRRHWRIFRPKFLGWRLFLMLIWYGLLLQMALPITLVFYISYFIFTGKLLLLFFILALSCLYYFVITSMLFISYILVISERKSYDFSFIPFLPLMPIYQLIMRVWAGISLMFEIFLKTHLDTTMAPYWVARQADKD